MRKALRLQPLKFTRSNCIRVPAIWRPATVCHFCSFRGMFRGMLFIQQKLLDIYSTLNPPALIDGSHQHSTIFVVENILCFQTTRRACFLWAHDLRQVFIKNTDRFCKRYVFACITTMQKHCAAFKATQLDQVLHTYKSDLQQRWNVKDIWKKIEKEFCATVSGQHILFEVSSQTLSPWFALGPSKDGNNLGDCPQRDFLVRLGAVAKNSKFWSISKFPIEHIQKCHFVKLTVTSTLSWSRETHPFP